MTTVEKEIVKTAAKEVGSKPIASDTTRAAYSVSPERNRPQYD
jgi:hypothetical protein